MAEPYSIAFGRYLKTLRERRGLSLDNVRSLSQTFADPINKGYLSRCENGHQRLAFSKVIALSRICEVPSDVLVERMELDMELDRVGGPVTEGKSFKELAVSGRVALAQGRAWDAYGFFRDATLRSGLDPVSPAFRNIAEQRAIAFMNSGTAGHVLGRDRFALQEFLYAHGTKSIGPKYEPVVLERIATAFRSLRDYGNAIRFANDGILQAEEYGDPEVLGYVYHSRGVIACLQDDHETAISYYNRAHDYFKTIGNKGEVAKTLNSLAQCYFDLGRNRAARLTANASAKLSDELAQKRSMALSLILLGEIDEVEERTEQAIARWRQAVAISKQIKDRELRFKAEFVLLRRAVRDGNSPVERAIRRRMKKLAPWIPKSTPELAQFLEMAV